MKLCKLWGFLVFIFLLFPTQGMSYDFDPHYNEQPSQPWWWINLGIGGGTTYHNKESNINFAPASQLSFNGAFTPNTFLTLYHNHISNTEETKKTWDNGIMGGYIQRTPSWYWALSGGVCYYRLESFLNWHYRESTGVGIPLQAQLFWTPFRHFGFGLIGHAVVSKDPLSTVFLGVQVLG